MTHTLDAAIAKLAALLVEDDEVTWFWIGGHADYDRLLNRL